MSLKDWLDNGWLKSHHTNCQEIMNLLTIVERDLADAKVDGLSPDWQYGIAYNAALKLCTIVLYAQGYRPENALAHYRTIMALKEIPGQDWIRHCIYLNECRMRRNSLEYDQAYTISVDDAHKLVDFATSFHLEVRTYLETNYSELISLREPT